MRSASRVAGMLALGVAAACIEPRGYPCEESSQCMLDGKQGRCEPTGFCSYPDAECTSEHRYEAHAGNGLGGACVDAGATGTSDGSSGTGPDMGTPGPCDGGACGCASAVLGGSIHSCALDGGGRLECWGGNLFGQLGRGNNGQAFDDPAPVLLPEGLSVVRYSAKDHACALMSDGRVYCWGKNDLGQSDWTDESMVVLEPRAVEGLDFEPELVAVGYGLSCAAAGDILRCWGDDEMPEPTAILGDALPGAARIITVGQTYGCAALDDETVHCFGGDARGQLGDGDGVTMSGSAEVLLPPHERVEHLATGIDNTCAVLQRAEGDEIYCWGDNAQGQGGSSPDLSETLPEPLAVALQSVGEYVDLAVDDTHACAVDAAGGLLCWGSNAYGMSSPWAPIDWPPGAQDVVPPEEPLVVTDVATGSMHTCVRLEDARIWCWGCNAAFQLGPGPDDDACEPGGTLLGEVVVPCD